jgi:hypothetical protein
MSVEGRPVVKGVRRHSRSALHIGSDAPPPAPGVAHGVRNRLALAGLVVIVVGASGLSAFVFHGWNDLDAFRWPMAELAVHGYPLFVYAVHAGVSHSDNGPATLVPLALVAAVVNALGWQLDTALRDAVAVAVFSVFSLLLAREAVLAIEAGRGRLRYPLLVAGLLLIAPPLWIGIVLYGHLDLAVELWLSMLAVRLLGRGRTVVAGLCLGLAVLSRTTVVLTVIPLVLLPLSEHRVRAAMTVAGVSGATVLAGWAPFVIADAPDVVHSLFTYRAGIPPLGGSLWLFLRGMPGVGTLQSRDVVIMGTGALVLTALAVWRRPGSAAGPRVYALLGMSAACLPLLAKTVWPYYPVDAYVFVTVWWLATPGRILSWRTAAPPLLGATAIVLAAYPPSLSGTRVAVTIACSTAVVVVIAILIHDWFAERVEGGDEKSAGLARDRRVCSSRLPRARSNVARHQNPK